MNLAMLANNLSPCIHDHAGVETTGSRLRRDELGKAKVEGQFQPLCLVEQRPHSAAWHLGLKPRLEFARVVDPPVRKKGGQRTLGEHHEVTFRAVGFTQLRDQASRSLVRAFLAEKWARTEPRRWLPFLVIRLSRDTAARRRF